jgi:GTP-dependent phosphoenolpyruvate carboxykinase
MSGANLIDDQAETSLPGLAAWVHDVMELTKPDDVVWCDGSEDEWERLTSLLVEKRDLHAAEIRGCARTASGAAPTLRTVSGSCIGTSSTASADVRGGLAWLTGRLLRHAERRPFTHH